MEFVTKFWFILSVLFFSPRAVCQMIFRPEAHYGSAAIGVALACLANLVVAIVALAIGLIVGGWIGLAAYPIGLVTLAFGLSFFK